MATMPSHGLRHVTSVRPWLRNFRSATTVAAVSSSPSTEDSERAESEPKPKAKGGSYFPKRGQTLELVCESLAFKGKGLCKVLETGFVVMCDRALPGERFIGRVTRKKGTCAEVTKVETLSPHWDYVDAPCEYSSYCGGYKTQNLSYEVQVRAKEQQVRELMINFGKVSPKELESIMKPIVPCDICC